MLRILQPKYTKDMKIHTMNHCLHPLTRCGLWITLLAALASPAAAATRLQAIQVWASTEQTRLMLSLSATTPYQLTTNPQQPRQLWLDLPETQLPTSLQLPKQPHSLIGTARPLAQAKGVRLVLELTAESKASAFIEVDRQGHHLMLDLTRKPAAKSLANPKPLTEPKPIKQASPPLSGQLLSNKPAKKAHAARKAKSLRKVIIAIDAGHGGKDPGALGHNGVQEKTVVLAIAKKLKQLIDRKPGMQAVLIRDDDYFIPLQERVNKARTAKADLLISIHADSAPNAEAEGASIYTLSKKGASSELAHWLADKENEADLVGGLSLDNKDDDVAQMILDLSMRGKTKESEKLAAAILNHLKQHSTVHQEQVQQAGFRVLKAPDITSVLVETAFLSNAADAKRLNSKHHQNKIAKAILQGVYTYLTHNPPPDTLLTQVLPKR